MGTAAVLALLLAGALASRDSAAARRPAAVEIVAFGDVGVGGSAQQAFGDAVRSFASTNPVDGVVLLGDNDYTEDPAAFESNWARSFGWARRRGLKIAAVLGNHDVRVGGGRYQYRTLGMRHRFDRRTWGEVELYLLDSTTIDSRQTSWLRRTLAASQARWKIAVFHHPAYTCGHYRAHPGVVSQWVPLFERYRVGLALSGHDHNYQRFAPRRGVHYVVHGGANPRHYAIESCPPGYPQRVRGQVEHGFLYLRVQERRLDGWSVRADGTRRDHFVLRG